MIREVDKTRVRARHHQHHDGRAVVSLSWRNADGCVALEINYPGGMTEKSFEAHLAAGRYDELIRNTMGGMAEATP